MDTEGLGALDEDSNHDVRIFSLAILLSSYFIYNSVGSIDENALQNLNLVVNLTKHIQIINPKILVLLGSTAMNALIGRDVVISKMRGKWIEKKFGNCKTSVIITFHPAFLMRQPAQKKMAWVDLKMIRDKKI